MKKICPKCSRELDTDKDFCVLCGTSYKNEELDNKIKEKLKKENKEEFKQDDKESPEKKESNIIPIILYGLGILILGPFVLGAYILLSMFGIDNINDSIELTVIVILFLLLIVGFVTSINKRKK